MIVVGRGEELSAFHSLSDLPSLALDTETYGLGWDDEMFSLILGTVDEQYYFNFNSGPDHLGVSAPYPHILNKAYVLELCAELLSDRSKIIFMHNPKYDMRRLWIELPVPIEAYIHDTEATARILRNDYLKYSLEEVAKREGFEKDMTVEEYIMKHKLYEWVQIPGKSAREKNKKYYLVPFDMMSSYGCRDVKITAGVGERQRHALGL